MPIRGVRGATIAKEDQPEAILSATSELLLEMLRLNRSMRSEDIASAFFTVTGDLRSTFPAAAARQIGWEAVPLMCTQEIPVPGSLPRCIRVLLHWNTALGQSEIRHVYLGAAAGLRPDLSPDLRPDMNPAPPFEANDV